MNFKMELFKQEVIDCIRFDSGLTFEELQNPWFKKLFDYIGNPLEPYVPSSVIREKPSEEILNKILFAIAKLYKNGTSRAKRYIIELAGFERTMENDLTLCLYNQAFMLRNSI